MKTLVLGIGNLILRDDGVGIRIARAIKDTKPEIEVIESSEAGLALLDYFIGYDKLIIIDSIKNEEEKTGELFEVEFNEERLNGQFCPSHGVDLVAAFSVGKGLGYKMPSVSLYAVNVKDNATFGESCSQVIEKSIPSIVEKIIEKENL